MVTIKGPMSIKLKICLPLICIHTICYIMITKSDDLLGTLIHDTAHNLRLVIDKKLADYNLTRVKWLALGIIRSYPGISQSALASRMELGDATVGRLVDRIEERGFLERHPNPDDRRAYGLHLTPDAKALIVELDHIAQELRADTLVGLDSAEIASVNAALIKIKKNLKHQLSAEAQSLAQSTPTAEVVL